MGARKVIMNFIPPSYDDLETIAQDIIDDLPEEIASVNGDIVLEIEDLVDETMEHALDLDDAYDLLLHFKHEKDIAPGIERKQSDNNGTLILFRRPILDEWCDSGEDLSVLIRQLIIEELGRVYDFSDDEIEDMVNRHHQGML